MLLDAVNTTCPAVVSEIKISGVIAPESNTRAFCDMARVRPAIVTPVGLPVWSVICTCAAGFAAGMRIVPLYPATSGNAVALGTVIGVNCPGSDDSC
jgi:hypothetical protein